MAAKPLSDNQTDTIGSYLAARLVELGVRDYFAVPGDFNLVLLDELLKNQKLRLVGCCNELNAGYAADGYARASGVAACVATYSVGGLSFVNAIAGAYAEDLSVVAISGGPNTNTEPSRQYLHHTLGEISYRYVVEVFQRVTAHAVSIDDPARALQQIDRALDICVSRRKPVYLEIACNLAAWPCSAPKPYVFGEQKVVTSRPALQEAVDRTAGMLNAALKPVLVAGVKLRPYDGREAFARLVEASGYATAVMSNAKGMISEKLPEFIGVYWGAISSPGVKEVIQSADAVLFAGPLFNDYTTCGYTMLLDRQKMIEVQPDAVVLAGNTYTNVTMKEFLGELAKKVKHNPASLRQFDQTKEETVPEPPMQPSKKLTRRRLFWLAQRVVTSNSAVIAETGDSWFNAIRLPLPEGCRFEIQMQYGSIGWSVGAILGYAMGAGSQRRVIGFVGDGAFQLTAQEVSTMIRYGLNPIIFLINNGGYTIEVEIHDGPYNNIQNWNYAKLIEVFNGADGSGWSCKVQTEGELDRAINQAIKHKGVSFIEVMIDRDDCTKELLEFGSRVARTNSLKPSFVV